MTVAETNNEYEFEFNEDGENRKGLIIWYNEETKQWELLKKEDVIYLKEE